VTFLDVKLIPYGFLKSLGLSIFGQRANFGLRYLDTQTKFNTYGLDREKLLMVLSNPAALKVISLQCDLFSLGRVCVKDAKDKEIEADPFLDFIGNPNPFQTEAQFKWDFMFWLMLGNCNTYIAVY
jgi:hypothetical protein